jgi:hypothetical protein
LATKSCVQSLQPGPFALGTRSTVPNQLINNYVSIKMLFIHQINYTANKHNGDYYIDFMRGIEE